MPHDHLFPGFYYLAQAFDYARQDENPDDTHTHIENALYELKSPPVLPQEDDTAMQEDTPIRPSWGRTPPRHLRPFLPPFAVPTRTLYAVFENLRTFPNLRPHNTL